MIDWLAKANHGLQTLAFCLAVSAIQVAIQPARGYEAPLVYSIAIGMSIWAVIDFGRELFPSAQDTGWPQGGTGLVLSTGGIVAGYLLGTLAGDGWFGWSSWDGSGHTQLPASLIITAVAGSAGTYFFYSRGRARQLERAMQQARAQATEARLRLLETQLEPHMLFNTLANLRVLIATDSARAQQMLDHMVAYLRATLDASRNGSHTLRCEFDRLHDYLELMAMRLGPRLQYQLELPDGLASQAIPALLLQPLVENAIRHGLEPQVAGGRILVVARRAADRLVLEVQDDGAGMPAGVRDGGGGIDGRGAGSDVGDATGSGGGPTRFGLAQVRERLATAFEGRASFECLTTAPGTCIRLGWPLAGATTP